ncbi:hypothetical protein PHYC_00150 [Phycisphaerales bacterium]|nr:hypothetical protein PHYC_00150 [Phycisphaerales bacterium]
MLSGMNQVLLALILGQPPASPSAPVEPFAAVARQHFAAWDRDSDGELSALEIDKACVDPTISGAQGAAVAALKRIVRSERYEVPRLTLEFVTAPPARNAVAPADRDRADSPEGASSTAPKRPPNLEAAYRSCVRRIGAAKRDLFLDETPDLDKCRQGPLGDCFFVASVGAAVHRDPLFVKSMMTREEDGRYTVRFPGRSVTLLELTDAEVALSSTTGDEGLWLPVLEKAMGTMRQAAAPERYAMESATDAIAKGGSSATVIRMLTGHETERIQLRRRVKVGGDGKPAVYELRPAGEADALAAQVREKVPAALAARRLVTAGSPTEVPLPPGINGKHAYAILSFDAEKDALTMWNPHGNTFRPKGDSGLEHGYPTRAGVFVMPVSDFVRTFSGVVLETDREAARRN